MWPTDGILSGATNPGQSGPKSNCSEGVLHILQSSRDFLLSYPRHSLEESYPSVEMQSVNSTASADWGQTEILKK